jgi:hypothetical protein
VLPNCPSVKASGSATQFHLSPQRRAVSQSL